jgi:hypothetical protein
LGRALCKVGDLFRATLEGGREVYVLYLGLVLDNTMPCVRVFGNEDCAAESIIVKDVLVGTHPPIRSGEWVRIKTNVPIALPIGPFLDFTLGFEPPFSPPDIWTLVDGKRKKRLGYELPEKYHQLTTALVQSWEDLKSDLEKGEWSTSGKAVLQWREYSRRHKAGLDPYG